MSSDYHVEKSSSTWFFSLSDKVQKLSKRISQKKKKKKKIQRSAISNYFNCAGVSNAH